MSAPTGFSASGLACSQDLHQTLPLPPPCHQREQRQKELWDGWSQSWGSDCKGKGQMVCGGGGHSSIILCCLLPGKGEKEQLAGWEHRKRVQEEYMHEQVKTDFKPSMRISITCSRTEKVLSLPICQTQEKEYFPLLSFLQSPLLLQPGVSGSSSSSCLGTLAEVGAMASFPVTSAEGLPGLCSLVAFSSACSRVRL